MSDVAYPDRSANYPEEFRKVTDNNVKNFESEIGEKATQLLDELIELYKTSSSLEGQLKYTIDRHQSELAQEMMRMLTVRRAEALSIMSNDIDLSNNSRDAYIEANCVLDHHGILKSHRDTFALPHNLQEREPLIEKYSNHDYIIMISSPESLPGLHPFNHNFFLTNNKELAIRGLIEWDRLATVEFKLYEEQYYEHEKGFWRLSMPGGAEDILGDFIEHAQEQHYQTLSSEDTPIDEVKEIYFRAFANALDECNGHIGGIISYSTTQEYLEFDHPDLLQQENEA